MFLASCLVCCTVVILFFMLILYRVYTTLAKEADPSEEPGPADGTTVHVCQVHPAQASQLTVGTVDETHEYQWIEAMTI